MTTTLRGDGVVFNDGSLQTTANVTPPLLSMGSYGIGPKARPGDLLWASTQPAGNVSPHHVATPYAIWQSGMLDIGTAHAYVGHPARAVGVAYTNSSTIPRMILVTTVRKRNWVDAAIYVNGVRTSWVSGNMDGSSGSTCSVWSIVPPGASYYVTASQGFSRWTEIGEGF